MQSLILITILLGFNSLFSNSPEQHPGQFETEISFTSKDNIYPSKWKVTKVEAEFKDHVSEENRRSYQDHLDMMEEDGYIHFLTATTFEGHNGLLAIDGTYQIEGDVLKTKNRFGFAIDYVILEMTDKSFVYQSNQDDVTIELHHKRVDQ